MKSHSIGSLLNPRYSLQSQMGLVFGALTILLTSVLSVAVGQESKARIENNIGRSMEQMAHQLTDDLDRGMYDYYLQTQEIALLEVITSSDTSAEAKREKLLHTLRIHDDIAWISLVNNNGIVVISTDPAQENQDLRPKKWFVVGQITPYITEVEFNDHTQTSIILYVTVTWRDENRQPLGSVITAVKCNFVEERVQELLDASPFKDLQIIVARGDGMVISNTNPPPALGTSWVDQPSYLMSKRKPSGYEIENPNDGISYLTGFATMNGFRDFAGLDWRAVVRNDSDVAFEPANALGNQILFTGLALGLGFAVLGYLAGGRITKPLVHMADAADAIRNGQETIKLPLIKGQDEVARLGHSLRTLVDKLTHEIEERTKLETQFRTMFELALDVILVADGGDGTILQVNPSVRRLLGYDPKTLIGKPFTSLFPAARESREEILERLKVYGAVFEEQPFQRQDGSVLPMDLTATLMPYGGKEGILITLRDISERQQLMLAQLESNAMRNQIEEQQEALQLKSTLVSVASHDLRNPLATILLSTDIIRQYGDRIPEEKRVGHFVRIETSIKYMQKLLDDLNVMEKLDRGLVQPTPEVIDMREFCNTLMDEALATTEILRKFQFSLDPQCAQIQQDPRLLRQAISNLLTNALKYSKDGPSIEFNVELESPHQLRVRVRDYGIGIPIKDQENLFKTFHRAKNAGGIPGSGLGLAITRRAIESMKGSLEFNSVENEGTTFILHIPVVGTPKPIPGL